MSAPTRRSLWKGCLRWRARGAPTQSRGCLPPSARRAPGAIQGHRVGEGAHARLTRPQIVTRLDRDFLDLARERRELEKQLEVRRPSITRHERNVARRLRVIPQQRDAIHLERRERIGHVPRRYERAHHPWTEFREPPYRGRHALLCALGGHDVGSALEPLEQFRE